MLLKGVTALVAGATGEVGRGAAYALSQAGAFVYLAGRSYEKLQEIQASLPNKEESAIIAVDYSTPEGAKELEEKIKALNQKLDLVVASSGPWWPIYKIAAEGDVDTIYQATQSSFVTHLFLYKVLAPYCKAETGQYIMVNGSAALNISSSGLTGVLANANVGAAQLMHDECTKSRSSLPHFTHALVSSSVGHADSRGNTHDPNEYGKAFCAMALNKHSTLKDASGTLMLDDTMFEKLSAMLL